MKAYLIARSSTEDQEDALPAQVYRLEDYARRNGYEAKLFELQESAYKDGRKLFGEIVEQIAAETEKVIVVFDKIDRYSRDSSSDEAGALRKLCKVGKIEIYFPSDCLTVQSTSPAQVWFMLGMGEATAEYYSRSVSDNVKRRQAQMLRDGQWTGKAPLGYSNVDRPDGKKWVEVDDSTADIVRTAYELYATGSHSLKTIRQRLLADYAIDLSNSQLYRVLNNPFYMGEMRIKGELISISTTASLVRSYLTKLRPYVMATASNPPAGQDCPMTTEAWLGALTVAALLPLRKRSLSTSTATVRSTKANMGQPMLLRVNLLNNWKQSLKRYICQRKSSPN